MRSIPRRKPVIIEQCYQRKTQQCDKKRQPVHAGIGAAEGIGADKRQGNGQATQEFCHFRGAMAVRTADPLSFFFQGYGLTSVSLN